MTIEEFKKQEIERMLSEHLSVTEIANSLGITRQSVWNWLKKNGYEEVSTWRKIQETGEAK